MLLIDKYVPYYMYLRFRATLKPLERFSQTVRQKSSPKIEGFFARMKLKLYGPPSQLLKTGEIHIGVSHSPLNLIIMLKLSKRHF